MTKVAEHDSVLWSRSYRKENVFGLQVAMGHPMLVKVGHSTDDLLHNQLHVSFPHPFAIHLPMGDKGEQIPSRCQLGEAVPEIISIEIL